MFFAVIKRFTLLFNRALIFPVYFVDGCFNARARDTISELTAQSATILHDKLAIFLPHTNSLLDFL